MGTRHHLTRQLWPMRDLVLQGNLPGFRYSSSQSLSSRIALPGDANLQQIMAPNFDNAFAQLNHPMELPLLENLTWVLQDCIEKKTLSNAWKLYMLILANGLDSSSILGDHLILMFIECRSVSAAQRIFHSVPCNSAWAWAYLIETLVKCGEFQQAISIFEHSNMNYACRNKYLYQVLLKACSIDQRAWSGQNIHCEIVKKGFDSDSFVGSTLLDMYAKNGMLEEAQGVFDGLLVKDVVSWSALICGYAESGCGEKAIQSLFQMQGEGVIPNTVTFMFGLKACEITGDIDKGREIYAELVKEEYENDLHVASALISMYINCGCFEEAQEVSAEVPVKDVVLWTTLIGGFAERGHGREALTCLENMQAEGFIPNAVTSVCSLKACGSLGDLLAGRGLHIDIIKWGIDNVKAVITTLMDMYMKCGRLADAQNVFDKLPVKSLVAWNTLIVGYVDHGCGQEALNSFEKMQSEGVSPDAFTLVCSLKACIISALVNKGQSLHTEIAKKGFEKNAFVGISLLDTYCKFGLIKEAQDVFDDLPARGLVSWNTLIMGYAEHGLPEKALLSLSRMHEEGVPMDAITAVCSLKACVVLGDVNRGRWIHVQVVKQALMAEDPIIGSALVDMYSKCNCLLEALEVFKSLTNWNAFSWATLLLGYAFQGEDERVFHFFSKMLQCGLQPDGVSLLSVLTVCSHTGLVEEGLKAFSAFSKDCSILPTLEHYNCMVDLLGRAGQLDKAVAMLNEMPFLPSFVTWNTLLGSCRKRGDVGFAKQAYECAAILTENKCDLFISMWGIYAENCMWQEMQQFQEMALSSW